jgi:enamine deaminase RidA (YjgF/YER057c/UK114 family)
MSQAVIVQRLPLVYTRQLLPLGRDGKLVGEGSADKQSEQVLANLESVLRGAGSGLARLVRLNICALSHEAAGCVRERLCKRLDPSVRPAITTVLTPLPHRNALVAVDAVAVAAVVPRPPGEVAAPGVAPGPPPASLVRCAAVGGDKECADAAVISLRGVAYLSGVPARGGLTVSAVTESLSTLLKTLRQLNLTPGQVVQLKVFLSPASSAEEVLREVKKFFPGQLVPPVVFVEWLASAPVEIELVAQMIEEDRPAEGVRYYTPPHVRPSPVFSRVALVSAPRQIFISGLSPSIEGTIGAQTRDVFRQLHEILAAAGSDMGHLAKATYYVSEDNAAHALDKVRPEFLDPDRPPAASKVMVHGVGQPRRTLTMDMIAVGSTP